jgi:methylmalonyl-CoA/ethylmalonyl-CoA epimerase
MNAQRRNGRVRVYRVDHVAQVVDDLASQRVRLTTAFGFSATHEWHDAALGYRGARLTVPGSRGHSWVLMEPDGTESLVPSWYAEAGGRPGLHHVGMEVTDLPATLAALEAQGIRAETLDSGRWAQVSLSSTKRAPGMLFWLRGPGRAGLPAEQRVSSPRVVDDRATVGITAINHISQASADCDELARRYSEVAGFVELWRTPEGQYPDLADCVLAVPGSAILLEILSPRGDNSFVDRFLHSRGPVGHHVTFQVEDWDRAVAACRTHGLRLFGAESGTVDGAEWNHAFIDPRDMAGTLLQLFWESEEGVWVRSKHVSATRRDLKAEWT